MNFGATVTAAGVRYRTWAPGRRRVEVAVDPGASAARRTELAPEPGGFFSGVDPAGRAGDRYTFVLDGTAAPDPASRSQPAGVFGPSAVVDPSAYRWRHPDWRRPAWRGRIVYELHLGTFTPAGTFLAAIDRLDAVVALGADTLEVMPVADFPGRWNWGYDGVMLFAPARCYGTPDDFRALIDAAHGRGVAVALDVVYNHVGPAGNPLSLYSPRYFKPSAGNPWGQSFNLDGEDAGPVRDFLIQNAAYWLDEFHLDGLRLDATHAIADASPRHLVADLAATARARGAFVIAEDERNDAAVIAAWGADAVWADDFHHSVRVALTGTRKSYFGSYDGTPAEAADVLEHGWKYRGEFFPHSRRPRGTPCCALPPARFVFCLENHDQVGNRPSGDRVNQAVSPAAYRAASVLLCLSPYTPMLFMGQEWAASSPFHFFTDHDPELGEKITEGRRREFSAHFAGGESGAKEFAPPQAETTFQTSKLRWSEADEPGNSEIRALYTACLRLRRAEAIFQNPERGLWRVWAIGGVLAIRWAPGDGDCLLLVRLWTAPALDVASEILRAPSGRPWRSVLHSEEPRFGGGGRAPATPAAFSGLGAWLLRSSPSP